MTERVSQEAGWSEQWTLGSDTRSDVTSATIALRGPSIYGQQEVEVIPKLEAEQRIQRLEADLRERATGDEALDHALSVFASHGVELPPLPTLRLAIEGALDEATRQECDHA